MRYAEKCGGARGATKDVTIWRIRIACWISKGTRTDTHVRTRAPARTLTHSDKYIIIDFSRQLWRERALVLGNKCVHCLSCLKFIISVKKQWWWLLTPGAKRPSNVPYGFLNKLRLFPQTAVTGWLSGAFAELLENLLLASSCPSVRPHGTAGLPLNGFWLNLTFESFLKSIEKIQILVKSEKNNGTLHEDVFTFVTVSRWIIYKLRNVSSNCRRESRYICFMSDNIFSENLAVYEIMSKNMAEPKMSQIKIWRRVACLISKAKRAQAHSRAPAPTPTHTRMQAHARHTHARTKCVPAL